MIGTLPVYRLAPLDYRYALDAALAVCGAATPLTLCGVPALVPELAQRMGKAPELPAMAALWVEPGIKDWREQLATLAYAICPRSPFVMVASRPLARWLPERRGWGNDALGIQRGGLRRLSQSLPEVGLRIESIYGIHSVTAMILNLLGQQFERWGSPALGDQLHMSARLHYCISGPLAPLSTVALLVARKEATP